MKCKLFYENNYGKLYNCDVKDFVNNNKYKNKIDLIFTSPPYAGINKYKNVDIPMLEEYNDWFMNFANGLYNILSDKGVFILNLGDVVKNKERTLYPFKLAFELREIGFKLFELLIWNKQKLLPNKKRFGLVHEYIFIFVKNINEFTFNIDEMRTPYSENSLKRMKYTIVKRFDRNDKNINERKDWQPNEKGALPKTIINISSETKKISDNHFAVFPEKLAEYFIKGFSNENDLIYDPFSGTGTTLLVSQKLNRKWIGTEISTQYCEEIKKRIENENSNINLF